MPDQPDYEPSDAELEMVVDEARQKTGRPPAARSAQQGIADMRARIQLLTEQKSKLLDQLELHPTDAQLVVAVRKDLSAVNKELREAHERLIEYQTQLGGRN